MAVKCIATCFGYKDPGDDGKGAFGDDNNNIHTVGVSLPIPIIRALPGSVHDYTVTVVINGKAARRVRITDEGPGEEGKLIWGKRTGLGHLLDLTYGVCAELGVHYDPRYAAYEAEFWIEGRDGKQVEVKGLDGPRHYVED